MDKYAPKWRRGAEYNIKKTELEKAYAQLNFIDAIRVRGVFRMILVLFAFGWLLYFVLSKLAAFVLPAAHAAQPVTSSSTFIPPLGLSQGCRGHTIEEE